MTSHDWRSWRDGDSAWCLVVMLDTEYICDKCGIVKGSFLYHNIPGPSHRPISLISGEPDCDQMIVRRIMNS